MGIVEININMNKKLITILIIFLANGTIFTAPKKMAMAKEEPMMGGNRSSLPPQKPPVLKSSLRKMADEPKMAKAEEVKEVGKGSAAPAPKPVLKKAEAPKEVKVGGKGSLPPMPKPELKKAEAKPMKKVGGKG